MKKKLLFSSLLVACLAVPTISVFGGCTPQGLKVTENTSLTTLKNELKKQNYSVMFEGYTANSSTYNRLVTYVTPNAIHTIYELTINNTKTTYEKFEFVIGEECFEISASYDSSSTKYAQENLTSKKYLADYRENFDNWGNFDYLTTKNNKLVPKSYEGAPEISLNFISGMIVTQENQGSITEKITLFNIGNTKINIPKEITLAKNSAEWAEVVNFNGVRYEKTGNTYTATINSSKIPEDYIFNVESTINNQKVAKVIVADRQSYADAKLYVNFKSDDMRAYGIGTYSGEFENLGKVEYDFSSFVAKGGEIWFADGILTKTKLSNFTTLDNINTFVENRNFTLEKTITEIDDLTGENTVTHYLVKYDGLLLTETETITTSTGKTVKESFVLELNGKFYIINYIDGDWKNYHKIDLTSELPESTLVGNFIDTLAEDNDGKLGISQSIKEANPYTNIYFENGDLQTVFFNDTAGTSTATETEFRNIGCTKIVIPQYVIDTVDGQENP